MVDAIGDNIFPSSQPIYFPLTMGKEILTGASLIIGTVPGLQPLSYGLKAMASMNEVALNSMRAILSLPRK
jgi:hypothetical protein